MHNSMEATYTCILKPCFVLGFNFVLSFGGPSMLNKHATENKVFEQSSYISCITTDRHATDGCHTGTACIGYDCSHHVEFMQCLSHRIHPILAKGVIICVKIEFVSFHPLTFQL